MNTRTFSGLCAAALATVVTLSPALAQDEEKKTVATVDGAVITSADIDFGIADFGQQLQRIPETERRRVVLDILIDMQLFANAAKKDGLEENAWYTDRIAFLKVRALRNLYFIEKIDKQVTDDVIKARYDKVMAETKPEEEARARHILVKSEDEAKAIIKELADGKDFAELAKEKSTGPSGKDGGDLGYFTKARMVKPFAEAAFAMEVGAFSQEPVKTQFGWHVIKLEDKRAKPLPTFESLRDELRTQLVRETFNTVLTDLKKTAKIELADDGKAEKKAE